MAKYEVVAKGHAECELAGGITVNAEFDFTVTVEASDGNEVEGMVQDLVWG